MKSRNELDLDLGWSDRRGRDDINDRIEEAMRKIEAREAA